MKIIRERLLDYLEKHKMTVADFARETKIAESAIEDLLSGGAVDKPTARKFICYLGADTAQGLIDWVGIGKVNPLVCDADKNGTEDGDK